MNVSLTLILLNKSPSLTFGKNDAAIEFYLNQLGEEIQSLDKKISSSNLTKGERNAYIL